MLAQAVEAAPLLQQQRTFFQTGATRDLAFRKAQLRKLKQSVVDREAQIFQALHADLRKPEFESYFELYEVIQEIDCALKHLDRWAKPEKIRLPLIQQPARAFRVPEPLGVALIIGPWNYPFLLILAPLVGAIAAGNCAILKPSELAASTSKLVADLVAETFEPQYVTAVEGGADASQALLKQQFDTIFYTGGTRVGKIVMAAAAEHLTPVTLELGGKSPCIVDADIDLKETAKRIAWGKFINAGQTCVAPDYLLVDRAIATDLLAALETCIHDFYGEDPAQSPDFPRIISDRHFQRLSALLADGDIVAGGQTDPSDRYIAPTLMANVRADAPILQEENLRADLAGADLRTLGGGDRLRQPAAETFGAVYILAERSQAATSAGVHLCGRCWGKRNRPAFKHCGTAFRWRGERAVSVRTTARQASTRFPTTKAC